jgi:hypothetical protein
MKKSLETAAGFLILAGVAGIVHRYVGWAPFGVVVRVARAMPYIRDNEIAAYVALIVLGLAALVVIDKFAEDDTRPRDETGPGEQGAS